MKKICLVFAMAFMVIFPSIVLAEHNILSTNCLKNYLEQPPYSGNCGSRPPGSVCIGYSDQYIWLIYDSIQDWRTETCGQYQIEVAVGFNGEYYHILDTNFVKFISSDLSVVPFDIKPRSCPNPINTRSKGVLPVAILGTDEFDVTQIDPATVKFEGVAPLRWSIEDVASPYAGDMEVCDIYACTELPDDGYLDLTLKFKTQEVVAALGEVEDGECLMLELTGNLKEEFGSTSFAGEDVVLILEKKKKK